MFIFWYPQKAGHIPQSISGLPVILGSLNLFSSLVWAYVSKSSYTLEGIFFQLWHSVRFVTSSVFS